MGYLRPWWSISLDYKFKLETYFTFRIKEKLKSLLKKWAEGDFKSDSALSLIVSLFNNLKKEGVNFNSQVDQTQRVPQARPAANKQVNFGTNLTKFLTNPVEYSYKL
jgi:hypothetical protein